MLSEMFQRGRRHYVTNRGFGQTMYRNQRLGVKTLLPDPLEAPESALRSRMGRPLLLRGFSIAEMIQLAEETKGTALCCGDSALACSLFN